MNYIRISRPILGLLLSFHLLVSCHAQQEAQANEYERYLSEAHARGQFNGVALVYDKGEIVHQGAQGIRSTEPLDPLDLNSQFRLASVSKQFTAMAIMLLKEKIKAIEAGAR